MGRVVLFIILTLVIQAEPFCEYIDIEGIEKPYKQDIKGMVFGYGYKKEPICKFLPNSNKAVVLLPYKEKDGDISLDEAYLLSFIIAIVDVHGKIWQSSFHKQATMSDAVSIRDITIDTKTYSSLSKHHPFGVIIDANARIMYQTTLLLYEPREKSIKNLLEEYILSIDVHDNYHYNNYEEQVGEGNSKEAKMKIKCKTHNYCNIPVEHLYSSFYQIPIVKDDFFEKIEEPIYTTLVYKDGIYKDSQKVERTFAGYSNIDTMLKKSKERYRYSRFDIGKLLFESLNKLEKRVVKLNNIAYYLQKNGQNREAVIMLELIVRKFPTRTVAYYNLGDAYWALGQKKEAKKMYEVYLKQMKARGKEKRVPKVVLERLKKR